MKKILIIEDDAIISQAKIQPQSKIIPQVFRSHIKINK